MYDNFGIIYFDELEKILNFKEELKDIKVNGEVIDITKMSSAYILLLLSYLHVNMNRNLYIHYVSIFILNNYKGY